jgi:hypothetical protein
MATSRGACSSNLKILLIAIFIQYGRCWVSLSTGRSNLRSGFFLPRLCYQYSQLGASTTCSLDLQVPRLTEQQLQELRDRNFVVVPKFLSNDLVSKLRSDVTALRQSDHFKVAKVRIRIRFVSPASFFNANVNALSFPFIYQDWTRLNQPNESEYSGGRNLLFGEEKAA